MRLVRKGIVKPRVFYQPEKRGRLVTLHACWVADNGYETAVFPTQEEAVEFARKRWRQEPVIETR
jgi:hypothetical protein